MHNGGNMKFIKENKKKIIIISVIVLVLIILTILVIFLINKNQEAAQKKDEMTERARQLVQNDYLYSYIYQGDVKTSEGAITVDDVTYYYVDDEKLADIHSIADINNLIKDTYTELKWENYFEEVDSINKYFENENGLYVAKGENTCNNIRDINIDDLYITNVQDDKMMIYWENNGVYAYNEDGTWRLGTNNFYCLDENNE